MQSRLESYIEAIANVAIGYIIAVATQIAVCPLFVILGKLEYRWRAKSRCRRTSSRSRSPTSCRGRALPSAPSLTCMGTSSLSLVAQRPDITLSEIAERLAAGPGVAASRVLV